MRLNDIDTADVFLPTDISEKAKEAFFSVAEKQQGLKRIQQSFQIEKYRGISYFCSGAASFSLTNKDMDILCGGTLGHKDWFGGSLFTAPNTKLTLHCIELVPIQCLFFPASKLVQVAEETPEIYKLLCHISSANLNRFLQTTAISFYGIKARTAYYLLDTASRIKKLKGAVPSIPITQQQLCDISGLSRPRVNEILKQLSEQEIIAVSRGKIDLVNTAKLHQCLEDVNLELYDPHKVFESF